MDNDDQGYIHDEWDELQGEIERASGQNPQVFVLTRSDLEKPPENGNTRWREIETQFEEAVVSAAGPLMERPKFKTRFLGHNDGRYKRIQKRLQEKARVKRVKQRE